DMAPLLDLVMDHVPEPSIEEGEFRMLATTIEANPYLGRILTGKITSGKAVPNQSIHALDQEGAIVETGRITQVLSFEGLDRKPVTDAKAGDIVSIAGLTKATVADTLVAPGIKEPIAAQPIDPPTLSMTFRVNDGPLAGQEGDKVQSRVIRDRLMKEAEGNVALKVTQVEGTDAYEVAGRGELQLAIVIETMRREGFELTVGRPRVLMETNEAGVKVEPVEEAIIDVDEEFSGAVVEKLSKRRADLVEMKPSGGGRVRLVFHAPTRGLIGYLSELMTDTKGTAIFNRTFLEYQPYRGDIAQRHTGALISNGDGNAVAFAMFHLEDRGPMMIHPGDKVYQGMIIGEHSRGNDLEVNVLKGKQLTNMRSSGKDEAVKITTPLNMTLEKSLAYITDDELVEVTPKNIRIRKRLLDPIDRKRAAKQPQN
ncbi:MAG: EF-Tu/IF-2/RF-3 family GTPase, partial [Pseudomonadota bacterium]